VTSLLVSELDALELLNLARRARIHHRVSLPSIGGAAEFCDGKVTIRYAEPKSSHDEVSVLVTDLRDIINKAHTQASNERRSNKAWHEIWDWANRSGQNFRVPRVDEALPDTLAVLHVEDEFAAVRLLDGETHLILTLDSAPDASLVGLDARVLPGPKLLPLS
jgi:hypothetical protein